MYCDQMCVYVEIVVVDRVILICMWHGIILCVCKFLHLMARNTLYKAEQASVVASSLSPGQSQLWMSLSLSLSPSPSLPPLVQCHARIVLLFFYLLFRAVCGSHVCSLIVTFVFCAVWCAVVHVGWFDWPVM